MILEQSRFSHAEDVHQELELPLLAARRELHIIMIMYKVINESTPRYLSDLFHLVSVYGVNKRGSDQFFFELPLMGTQKGQYAFSFMGASAWNQLPSYIRELATESCV